MKVMAGDAFNIRVSSWYKLNGVSPGTPANPLSDLVTALIAGVSGLPGGAHPTASSLQANSTVLSDNITQFLSDTAGGTTQGKPLAFVNWVLFDNQFNYVAESSGVQQVGTDQELKKHVLTDLSMTKSGYLYIYLSNETPNVSVFFDNLQVTHVRGPLLESQCQSPARGEARNSRKYHRRDFAKVMDSSHSRFSAAKTRPKRKKFITIL
ncbi:MAG: hypothetical protein QM755_17900 [Luteolibacter sp.]